MEKAVELHVSIFLGMTEPIGKAIRIKGREVDISVLTDGLFDNDDSQDPDIEWTIDYLFQELVDELNQK